MQQYKSFTPSLPLQINLQIIMCSHEHKHTENYLYLGKGEHFSCLLLFFLFKMH